MNWEKFCNFLDGEVLDLEKPGSEEKHKEIITKLKKEAEEKFQEYGVYPESINTYAGGWLFIARDNIKKSLILYGKNSFYDDFEGIETAVNGKPIKICDMNNKNCDVIMRMFPYTRPTNHKGKKTTIGLGDRLGLASPGHIRLIKNMPVFPVLAQQSIRELNLTGRTYKDVLCAASWAVFQEGYTSGFGADGDHLKTPEEVEMALDNGFTMITLDCSEHIDNKAAAYSPIEVDNKYMEIEERERQRLESKYTGKSFRLKDGTTVTFNREDFKKIVLVYLKAVKYTIDIYNRIIKNCGRNIDFEMSVDETLTSTTPESHYFVASELIAGGVEITSLAPRFCGEFQKGIDYIGDIEQFKKEFTMHVKIAQTFGYKISVHSGSDKFAVFPIIGKTTGAEYHLKTAGTNWLEAVRVIAAKNPSLYRRMHKFALENLCEAKKYYHISGDPSKIPDIDTLKDEELPDLMDKDDSRQVMHITYGLILKAKKPNGKFAFKDDIYSTLHEYEEDYYSSLKRHIGKHLDRLGL
ncbi:MAG: hypothetical protein HPY74_00445 [Firmicutes bacterium]|nr:hypothetical protein [Bacillota bacterium]